MADQEAERLVENARSEAARALDEATSEADRIRVDAQAHAEEARQEGGGAARARQDGIGPGALRGLAERRRSLVEQLRARCAAKLHPVAEDLAAPDRGGARLERGGRDRRGRTSARPKRAATTPIADDAPVDPRYEDSGCSDGGVAADIPDLASIDLDFDEPDE